jgi:hypothetical protein
VTRAKEVWVALGWAKIENAQKIAQNSGNIGFIIGEKF